MNILQKKMLKIKIIKRIIIKLENYDIIFTNLIVNLFKFLIKYNKIVQCHHLLNYVEIK